MSFRCKTVVFEGYVSADGNEDSLLSGNESFHFDILTFPQLKDNEHLVPFPVPGELLVAFYCSVAQGGYAFLGSLNIELGSFEKFALEKEEFVENGIYTTISTGSLPVNVHESFSAEMRLEISWYRSDIFGDASVRGGDFAGQFDEHKSSKFRHKGHNGPRYKNSREKFLNTGSKGNRLIKKGQRRDVQSAHVYKFSGGESKVFIKELKKIQLNELPFLEIWKIHNDLVDKTAVRESEGSELLKGLHRIDRLNEKHYVLLEKAHHPATFVQKINRATVSSNIIVDFANIREADIPASIPIVFCRNFVDIISEYGSIYDLYHVLSLRMTRNILIIKKIERKFSTFRDADRMFAVMNSTASVRRLKYRSSRSLRNIVASSQLNLRFFRESVQGLVDLMEKETVSSKICDEKLLNVDFRYSHLHKRKNYFRCANDAFYCLHGYVDRDSEICEEISAVDEI